MASFLTRWVRPRGQSAAPEAPSPRRRRAPTTGLVGRFPPPSKRPWAFTKGVIVGAVVVIPAIAVTVWLLGKLGIGDPELRLLRAIRVTALFAGIAAVLTAGGVGRLAAQTSVDSLPASGSPAAHEEAASRRKPVLVAARTFAAAGAALTIIAILPHGVVPETVTGWIAIALAGAATGAACGAVIGAVCGGTATLDVMALARWPTDVLRQLLEPEDLAAAASTRPRKRRITFPFLFGPKPDDAAAAAEVKPPAPPAAPERADPGDR